MIIQSGIDKILITYKEGKTIALDNDIFTVTIGDGVLQITRARYPDSIRFVSLSSVTNFTIHIPHVDDVPDEEDLINYILDGEKGA